MTPDEYQALTKTTEIYTDAAKDFIEGIQIATDCQNDAWLELAATWLSLSYCTGKMNGEAGETAELIFKAFRDGKGEIDDERREKLLKELGDVQWYVARIAGLLGFSLEFVMKENIVKLQDRKERGVLSGSGDDR